MDNFRRHIFIVEHAYIGTMLDNAALDALLEQLLPQMGIVPYRWPLIVKEGRNDGGETIRFLLNYSSMEQVFRVEDDVTELLSQKQHIPGEALRLEPWAAAVFSSTGTSGMHGKREGQ